MDQYLNWKVQQAHAVEKGTKWAAQIRRMARLTWGILPKYARCLYISVAIPRILYAVDIWCITSRSERMRESKLGLAKVIDQVVTIQRAGALAITGGLRTLATDLLNAHAYLLPAMLTVRKWCHHALIRMAMLPKEHPLHKYIKQHRIGKIKRHKGPLHHLTKWFKVDANAIKKIPSTARDPSKIGKIPLVISITENREDLIKETEGAPEDLQIYSDSSALKGKVGAAAILILNGRHIQTLQFHLRTDTEHTVHKAELVGLLLSLHMLSSREYRRMPAMIGIDNQVAIKALSSDLRSPGHHLAWEALHIASRIAKKGRKSRKLGKTTITIRWTVGHEGIEGNELADKEAKEAAKGHTSDTKHLPPYLRKPLLINPTVAKAAHNAALKNEWQNEWRNSKQGKALAEIDESTLLSKFLKSISNPKLSRMEASRIAQIRLSHFPLNGYLKRV